MVDTRMPAIAYARKLRARRDELKAKRDVENRRHKAAVAKWRVTLQDWIVEHATLLAKNADAERKRWGEFESLSAKGMPQPPKAPSGNSRIRKIESVLRRLALTGQKDVVLRADEVDELFGDEADE